MSNETENQLSSISAETPSSEVPSPKESEGQKAAETSGQQESKPEVPSLTPEQQAALEAKRKVFRSLVGHFNEQEVNTVAADMSAIMALISSTFDDLSKKTLVGDLVIETEKLGSSEEDMKQILAILKDTPIYEALDMFTGAMNAVRYECQQKLRYTKVKDLEIKFL